MALALVALVVAADDPHRLAAFWGGMLGREVVDDPRGGLALLPEDDTGFGIRFAPGAVVKTGRNQVHPDLTSESLEDQQRLVRIALSLGGSHLDIGQGQVDHVVLADPEGNELCVIAPGNAFLEGCGRLGCLAGDGSYAVGHFWAAALGWPLVWDEGEETAIQSPRGGTKLSWGGPPYAVQTGRARLHLDLAPTAGSDQATEVERLLWLGAARVGHGDGGEVVLADVDGNELCVLP